MRKEAWQELLNKSDGMTIPAAVSGAFAPEEIDTFMNLYVEIFREFIRRGAGHLGLKVFTGSEMDHTEGGHLMQTPPLEEEALTLWTERLFGGKNFGIILNNLEKYSDRFARTATAETNRLLALTGMPLGGLAFLLFAGNYGFTPFGVHKDNPGEEGFLFHMGPGVKKLYTWETNRFLELSGGLHIHTDPASIISEAENAFTLAPGDIAFLPSGTYHVADTPEFSVSMVMDFVNPPPAYIRRTIAARIAEEEMQTNGEPPLPPLLSGEDGTGISQLLPALRMGEEVERAFEDYILRLQSNAGLYTPAEPNRNGNAFMPGEGEELRLADPFRIFYRRSGPDRLTIYSRGRAVRSPLHPRLTDWLDRLNKGEGFSWEEIRGTFEPEWDVREILFLLGGLGEGIELQRRSDKESGEVVASSDSVSLVSRS